MSNYSRKCFCSNSSYFRIFKNSKEEVILYVDPPLITEKEWKIFMINLFRMIENIENSNIFKIIIEHESKLEVPKF